MNCRFPNFAPLRQRISPLLLFALSAFAPSWCAAEGVLFDQSVYQVAPGETFAIQVLIDGELGTPEADPVSAGLFSYGWQVTFDSTKATVDNVDVPDALDFFAFAPGASIVTDPGLIAAEGNVDQVAFDPYEGSLLATITLVNTAPVPEEYLLTLSLAPHFPGEELFLDGKGIVLDDNLVFGTARVIVAIPEPASGALLGLGGLGALILGRRVARKPKQCGSSS
jgi:hypothetical protein